MPNSRSALQVDERQVVVDCHTGKVDCPDEGLRARVERALARLTRALEPAALDSYDDL